VSEIETQPQPPLWKTLTAFAIIYVVWGSTFLAIRIGVAEVPPFLFAAMRFFTAGLVLYLWQIFRGEPNPTRREWASITLLASLSSPQPGLRKFLWLPLRNLAAKPCLHRRKGPCNELPNPPRRTVRQHRHRHP
jgi:hypothetical protein